MKSEKKSIELEFKDIDSSKRTAVIKHAVYTSIDRTKDIATKGMFTKSWNETKAAGIDFLFNHVTGDLPGNVTRVHEDDAGAYTEVKFGNWTLGNDVMEMADAGVLKGASFGYFTEKKDFVNVKGQRIRKLLEVKHVETSLLTVLPAHPEAGVIALTKAFNELELKSLSDSEQVLLQQLLLNDQTSLQALVSLMGTIKPESDLYTWISWQVSARADRMGGIMSQLKWNTQQVKSMRDHVDAVEKYMSKANASDESIISLADSLTEYKQIISSYDTAITGIATQPAASIGDGDLQLILNALKN